jgi:hypothetical protein
MKKIITSGLDEIKFRNFKDFNKMLKNYKAELKKYRNIYIRDVKIKLR